MDALSWELVGGGCLIFFEILLDFSIGELDSAKIGRKIGSNLQNFLMKYLSNVG